MLEIFNFLKKNNICEPPWDYNFLVNLDEKEYPKYLAKIFNYRTGEKLPLKYDFKTKGWIIDKKRCKTFNQKIQWLKLYGVTHLMRQCTDKVAVRDYVKEKIGEEYLKPVLQIIPAPIEEPRHSEPNDNLEGEESRPTKEEVNIQRPCDNSASNGCLPQYDGKTNDVSTYFDQIQWDKLPNAFVIKTNHGCKWQYIIKDKEEFLQNKQLFEIVKKNITGWLEQEYWCWGGFEMQYRDITPQIIIEELIRNKNEITEEIEIYCFNGVPKIIKNVHNDAPNKLTMYDENLNCIDFKFQSKEFLIDINADENIKIAYDLSKKLSKDFSFVRVDWLVFESKLYFNELTFSPNSGFLPFNNEWNIKLGNLI